MGTDGSGFKNLIIENGASKNLFNNDVKLSMNGSKMFMFTVSNIPKNVIELLNKSKINISKIKKFFFHQGSKIILDTLQASLKLPKEKVFNNLKYLGNTVSSTIPISLKQANDKNKIRSNDLLLLSGFGVGLSWGSCIIKWKKLK